jgi:hypothetical protein
VSCKHEEFAAEVEVNRLADVGRFVADVSIHCAQCGKRFRFLGLPAGVDLNGAATDVAALTASLAIAPYGEVVSALDGAPQGFTVRLAPAEKETPR